MGYVIQKGGILRHRRSNPQKFPARFARQETEQSFEISPLKYEPKLDLFDTNLLSMTTHEPLTTAAPPRPPPDGVRYSLPKFKILKRIGGTLLTLKFWAFSDGVRYSEERILRHRRPNPNFFRCASRANWLNRVLKFSH